MWFAILNISHVSSAYMGYYFLEGSKTNVDDKSSKSYMK